MADPEVSNVVESAPEVPVVTIGAASAGEAVVLAELYASTLEAEGFEVERDMAMDRGMSDAEADDIDILPRYVSERVDNEPDAGFVFLEPVEFDNESVLATNREITDRFGVQDVSDFVKVPNYDLQNSALYSDSDPMLSFYEYMELNHEPDMSGVDDVGYRPYREMERGSMHGILIASTDGDILAEDLIVLEDRLGLIEEYDYSAAPMVREELASEYPQVRRVLDRVAANLTLEDMRKLNYAYFYGDSDTSYEEVIEEYVEEMPESR